MYFTLLRDPIERVLSHYSFVRNYPGYESVAHGKSFSEYLELAQEAANGQTLQVAGLNAGRDLEVAKENLRSFGAVGVTDMFDDFLAVLQREFSWKNVEYCVENITKDRLRREDVSAADLRKVKKMNELDQELYEYAKGLQKDRSRLL